MNGWNLVPGYKNIGTKEDVCGGDPTIIGTRLEPIFIASYGLDAIEDFGITKEQYEEAVKWIVQEIKRLREERNKLIEGLRKLAKTNAENISEIREWKAKQNDPEVIDLDWYNYVARDILKEIGVTAARG